MRGRGASNLLVVAAAARERMIRWHPAAGRSADPASRRCRARTGPGWRQRRVGRHPAAIHTVPILRAEVSSSPKVPVRVPLPSRRGVDGQRMVGWQPAAVYAHPIGNGRSTSTTSLRGRWGRAGQGQARGRPRGMVRGQPAAIHAHPVGNGCNTNTTSLWRWRRCRRRGRRRCANRSLTPRRPTQPNTKWRSGWRSRVTRTEDDVPCRRSGIARRRACSTPAACLTACSRR